MYPHYWYSLLCSLLCNHNSRTSMKNKHLNEKHVHLTQKLTVFLLQVQTLPSFFPSMLISCSLKQISQSMASSSMSSLSSTTCLAFLGWCLLWWIAIIHQSVCLNLWSWTSDRHLLRLPDSWNKPRPLCPFVSVDSQNCVDWHASLIIQEQNEAYLCRYVQSALLYFYLFGYLRIRGCNDISCMKRNLNVNLEFFFQQIILSLAPSAQ